MKRFCIVFSFLCKKREDTYQCEDTDERVKNYPHYCCFFGFVQETFFLLFIVIVKDADSDIFSLLLLDDQYLSNGVINRDKE